MADLIRRRRTDIIDPYDVDDTTLVSVTINGVESDLIREYCYDSDILQLGDPFSVTLPDPYERWTDVLVGDPIVLNMASPLAGGRKVQKITGIITQLVRSVDERGGTVLNVAGADLGWHLVNNDAPIWKRLHGGMLFGDPTDMTKGLVGLLVDSSWGFKGFRTENDTNIRIKMGGSFTRAIQNLGEGDRPPIVQIEPGDKPADIMIQYAKLINRLINVSGDGYLQLFSPNYDQPVAYRFYNYRTDPARRAKNNVKRVSYTQRLDGVYTKGLCVGTRVIARTEGVDPNDPNKDSFYGVYEPSPAPLRFKRLRAFADADRLSSAQVSARAKWAVQRAAFDSSSYVITVRGHTQNGVFYEPDTLCEVYDEYCGIGIKTRPLRYVTAVKYNRDRDNGLTTELTLNEVGLLAA
jgi:prophage tail gpP-like protein